MWKDVCINIFSDLMFLVAATAVYSIFYLITDRRRLLKFFGIWESKRITIYISNLNILRGGAAGSDGLRYSFQGAAIAAEESKAVTRLQSLFNYFLPKQIDKPNLLNKLFISDIDVEVMPAPSDINAIEQSCSVIGLGSPAYNFVSGEIQKDSRILAKFGNSNPTTADEDGFVNENGRIVPSGSAAGTAIPVFSGSPLPTGTPLPSMENFYTVFQAQSRTALQIEVSNVSPYHDPLFGFIQRYFDYEKQRNVFYVAGLSDFSTAGCVYYLISNWKKLFKKYGDKTAFVVLIKVDATNNNKCQIVFEKTRE